jgi:hypothetical protein
MMVSLPFQIKVGANRLVNRTSLLTIEEASAHFCGRVELLVELFYGAKASRYSVKPKSNHHISMEEIESMKGM